MFENKKTVIILLGFNLTILTIWAVRQGMSVPRALFFALLVAIAILGVTIAFSMPFIFIKWLKKRKK